MVLSIKAEKAPEPAGPSEYSKLGKMLRSKINHIMRTGTSQKVTKRSGETGVTLLELIVVMGLLALALGVALPNLRPATERAPLRLVAEQLTGDLKRARTAAMIGNRPVALIFEPASHTYRIDGAGRPVRLPRTFTLTMRSATAGSVDRLVFFPDGSATGGQLALRDAAGQTAVLTLDWLTGMVRQTRL